MASSIEEQEEPSNEINSEQEWEASLSGSEIRLPPGTIRPLSVLNS